MSQIYKSAAGSAGIVDSITGIAPIAANGVSGVAQTGNVSISFLEEPTTYTNVVGPTTYTVNSTDYYLSCNTTAGSVTIVLPATNTYHREFLIKDRTGTAATNDIVITSVGAAATFDINEFAIDITDAFGTVEVLYASGNYEII